MAVVVANYIRNNTKKIATAKANIRYIENRPAKDGKKVKRELFGRYGHMERAHAYEIIDKAKEGSNMFRLKISPDAKLEDSKRDLLLQEITQRSIAAIEDRIGIPVQWVAAIHDDHSPLRHVHVLAIVEGRLNPQDLNALRGAATQASLEQRRELDLAREEKQREREEEEWEY